MKIDFRKKEVKKFLESEIIYRGYIDMYWRFRLSAWQDGIKTPEFNEVEKKSIVRLKNKLLERLQ